MATICVGVGEQAQYLPVAFRTAADVGEGQFIGGGRLSPPLLWDAQGTRFTNNNDANQYLSREYRDGWKLG